MRTLTVIKYNGNTTITITEDLNGYHKDSLHIGESGINRLAGKVEDIAQKAKVISGYQKTNIYFSPIDWYESCDSFEVPYVVLEKGKRKAKVGYDHYNDIPKDWEKSTQITTGAKTMPGILKNIKILLGYELNEAAQKELRKALKNNKCFSYEY